MEVIRKWFKRKLYAKIHEECLEREAELTNIINSFHTNDTSIENAYSLEDEQIILTTEKKT